MEKFIQVDLQIPELPGFTGFIGAWIGMHEGRYFVVDPGPTVTIPLLLGALKIHGISQLDYILLTHIHVDHAGGTGTLIESFPSAHVICHPNAIKHLVSPSRLYEGSRQVLGGLMDHYGPIKPVDPSRIISVVDADFQWLPTPGHSAHHVSYLIDRCLFAGESLGVSYPTSSSGYLRPATPMRFFYASYRDSVERLKSIDARSIMLAHFGELPYSVLICERALEQVDLWDKVISEYRNATEEQIFLRLLKADPNMAEFGSLPLAVQEREKLFIRNSIRGIRHKE